MSKQKIEDFWALLESVPICMVSTVDDDTIRARPMAPYIERETGLIRFLTDRTSSKVEELNDEHTVALTFTNTQDMKFASFSGRASVTTDRGLVDKMWGPYAETFFPGDKDTADVAVITVRPLQGEYWDNDISIFKMGWEVAKGYFTENTPDLGDNGKVALQ
ncbi:MAG: pyridoxamine 5'-phosphate oxidase family protein [Pseudomonadota bacterium]